MTKEQKADEHLRALSEQFKNIEEYDLGNEVEVPRFEIVRNSQIIPRPKPAEWDEERV